MFLTRVDGHAGFLGPPGIVDLSLDFEWYLKRLVETDLEAPLPLRVHLMVPAPSMPLWPIVVPLRQPLMEAA